MLLVTAKTMVGADYWVIPRFHVDQLQQVLSKHGFTAEEIAYLEVSVIHGLDSITELPTIGEHPRIELPFAAAANSAPHYFSTMIGLGLYLVSNGGFSKPAPAFSLAGDRRGPSRSRDLCGSSGAHRSSGRRPVPFANASTDAWVAWVPGSATKGSRS